MESNRTLAFTTLTTLALLLLCAASSNASAQSLRPKRSLTVGVAPGCESAPTRNLNGPRDNAEARRLAAAGQEAALIGDQTAARDAFAKAAALNPGDDRIAYDLGRANEELADSLSAVGEYCRYLTLSPAGREAADVRARLLRLVPKGAAQSAQELLSTFRLGLFLYDSAKYDAAERAFDDVVHKAPSASEGYFNRGLMRAAIGRRAESLKDFEAYLAAVPAAEDRVDVTRTIATLRRPVYGEGTAFARGIVPGFGQFYTGRPVLGVVVLAGVVASAGLGIYQKTSEKTIAYVDPNNVPAPYTQQFTERPYLLPGIAAAVGLTLGAALEAVFYAKRSGRGADVLQSGRTSSTGTPLREYGLQLMPTFDVSGRAGFHLTATF
ncbi:MAG: tetratricopeptide repeat protein [Gemmatimonadaceae bacterium]